MQLTRLKFASLIKEAKPDRFNLPKEKPLTEFVAKKLDIVADDCFKEIIKKELNYYKRLGKTYGTFGYVILNTENFFPASGNKENVNAVPSSSSTHFPAPCPKRHKSLQDVCKKQLGR